MSFPRVLFMTTIIIVIVIPLLTDHSLIYFFTSLNKNITPPFETILMGEK